VDECEGGSKHLLAAAVAPWFVRWLLLRDSHHYFGPPGEDEEFLIHVICPRAGCGADDWVPNYEPSVDMCNKHRPRISLELCPKCARKHGYHRPREGSQ